jgi:hypothetical protein
MWDDVIPAQSPGLRSWWKMMRQLVCGGGGHEKKKHSMDFEFGTNLAFTANCSCADMNAKNLKSLCFCNSPYAKKKASKTRLVAAEKLNEMLKK